MTLQDRAKILQDCLPDARFKVELTKLHEELIAEIGRYKNMIHSCGPTCTKAGCINRRLIEERDALKAELKCYHLEQQAAKYFSSGGAA